MQKNAFIPQVLIMVVDMTPFSPNHSIMNGSYLNLRHLRSGCSFNIVKQATRDLRAW